MKTTSEILRHQGYDDYGNQPALRTPEDHRRIEAGEYQRVGGDALCPVCGSPYHLHPAVQGALSLTRACPDVLVKL